MNRKSAFTLIELLVVIAIIAILAAILFPVFAQAKLQAKKSASLSNTKQITLSNIMYENDYDDNFVLSAQNNQDWQCGKLGITSGVELGGCLDNYTVPTMSWPQLLNPYIKTYGLFVDPATGDPSGVFSTGGPNAIPANWNTSAQYAYNYTFLSPIYLPGLTGGGTLVNFSKPITGVGRSSTAAINPAGTPMFVSDQGFGVSSSGVSQATAAYPATGDFDLAVPPGVMKNLIDSPDRLVYVGCVTTSDPNCKNYSSAWIANTPQGDFTANVRTLNPYTGALTGFVDGHAKSQTAGALAVGTDYGTATTTENTAYGSGCGSGVTNLNAYVWSLDGTLNDVN